MNLTKQHLAMLQRLHISGDTIWYNADDVYPPKWENGRFAPKSTFFDLVGAKMLGNPISFDAWHITKAGREALGEEPDA